MGKGKGNVEYWVAVVKPGRMMFEVGGLDAETAIESLNQASYKFSIQTKVVARHEILAQRATSEDEGEQE
jgi:large subunit ribosomal protein L16